MIYLKKRLFNEELYIYLKLYIDSKLYFVFGTLFNEISLRFFELLCLVFYSKLHLGFFIKLASIESTVILHSLKLIVSGSI